MSAPVPTADLYDRFEATCRSCETQFRQFGGRRAFSGRIRTVRCRGDNLLIRRQFEVRAEGGVLVVDGGGSLQSALVGDMLAGLAMRHGWAGAVIFGAIRDTAALAGLDFGLKALGSNPRRGTKTGTGETDVAVTFGGADFIPGHWLYSDDDGIIVSAEALSL
jgi:regulator of ribonuclease activity A